MRQGTSIDRADLAACKALLRRGSRSFFAASLLLPRRVRAPVAGMYAFCRVADDAVDLGGAGDACLDALRRRLERLYAGRPADDPVDRVFAAVVRGHAIPRAVPEALLEGFAWDLEGRRYETLSEVRAYAARVASSVGVMMSRVMGGAQPAALARACDLGVAMQLTNIARDVGEDARAGRLYLPGAWLREVGLEAEAFVRQPRPSPELGVLVERLLAEADRLYARADLGVAMLPAACRPAVRAARLIYADIGRVLRHSGLDPVSRRARTSGWRKLRLIVRALLAGEPSCAEAATAPSLEETRFLVSAS